MNKKEMFQAHINAAIVKLFREEFMSKTGDAAIVESNNADRYKPDSSLDLIDKRMQWAQYIANQLNGSTTAWLKSYADDFDNTQLSRDLRWMRSTISHLQNKIEKYEYALEAAGVKPEDTL